MENTPDETHITLRSEKSPRLKLLLSGNILTFFLKPDCQIGNVLLTQARQSALLAALLQPGKPADQWNSSSCEWLSGCNPANPANPACCSGTMLCPTSLCASRVGRGQRASRVRFVPQAMSAEKLASGDYGTMWSLSAIAICPDTCCICNASGRLVQ